MASKNIITDLGIKELITKIKTALNEKISNDDLPYTVNKEEQTVTFKDDYAYVNANIFHGACIETESGFQVYETADGRSWVVGHVFGTIEGGSLLTDADGYNYYGGFEEEGGNLNVLVVTNDGDTDTYSLGTLKVATPTHDHDAATKEYVDSKIKHKTYTVEFGRDDWVSDTSNGYSQTVDIEGVTANDEPLMSLTYPTNSIDSSNAEEYETSYNYISTVTTGDGTVTAKCLYSKPTMDVTVKLRL